MVIPVAAPALGGVLKLAGGLFGLFGKKKDKIMTPAESIMSTATGVTDAAKATGLNRLTLLGASNATAGAGMNMGGGGAPPLASLSVLGGIIDDEFGQDAKDRREHNRLQNDLLRIEVDRSRSVAQVPTSAVLGVGPRASLGTNNTATVSSRAGSEVGPFSMSPLTDDRQVKQTPTEDLSGFMKVRNAWTDEDGMWVPGSDGEVMSPGQIVTFAGAWAADNAWKLGSRAGTWLRDSPSSPIRRKDFKDNDLPDNDYYKKYPYGRDAYGRALPKPTF